MYSKQEAACLRQEFWTTFGQYIKPVPSAGPEKVQWINYKTHVRYINFKMKADDHSAYIAIEFSHPSTEQRIIYFEHLRQLKKTFEKFIVGKWIWQEDVMVEYTCVSRTYTEITDINIYKKSDWPELISFFKIGITGIDRFWAKHKEIFEMIG